MPCPECEAHNGRGGLIYGNETVFNSWISDERECMHNKDYGVDYEITIKKKCYVHCNTCSYEYFYYPTYTHWECHGRNKYDV